VTAKAATLLVINPNSSSVVTDRLVAKARRVAPPGVAIRAVTATSAPAALQTPDDLAAAKTFVLAAIEANADCAAAVIGAFGDPGLDEARSLAAMPIVGLGEAGILAAGAGGRRFSIVTVGEAMRALLLCRIARLGLREQLASLHFLPHSVIDVIADRDRVLAAAVKVIGTCIENDGARAILLGGAPFAGAARELARQGSVPILDGVDAAIRFASSSAAYPEADILRLSR
jgi:allantoin racemase